MAFLRTFAHGVAVRALLAILLTSAATTVSSSAHAEGASPSVAAKSKAKRAFERGEKLYKSGKFEEAAAAFQESYDEVPDPKALMLVARIQRDNGELLKARATYQQAQEVAQAAEANGQGSRATLDEIKNEVRDIDGVLGFISIELSHAPPGTRVSIDGSDVTRELGKPIRAEPGPLVVSAITPDGVEKSENAMVKAGQSSSVTLSFAWSGKSDAALAEAPEDEGEAPPPPPKKQPEPDSKQPLNTTRTLAWVAGGVGVVGLSTFAVFGALSASKFKHLAGDCPDNHCDPSLENDKNTGKTFQTVANVGLVVGAVGLGAAITLFALGGARDATHGDNHAARRKKPAQAKLELGLGRVAFSGSFQ